MAAIGRLIGVLFLSASYKRTGHLAVEPDCFIERTNTGAALGYDSAAGDNSLRLRAQERGLIPYASELLETMVVSGYL